MVSQCEHVMCQKQILSASVVHSGATLHKNNKSDIMLHQMCHQTPVLLIHLIASVENQKNPQKNNNYSEQGCPIVFYE